MQRDKLGGTVSGGYDLSVVTFSIGIVQGERTVKEARRCGQGVYTTIGQENKFRVGGVVFSSCKEVGKIFSHTFSFLSVGRVSWRRRTATNSSIIAQTANEANYSC